MAKTPQKIDKYQIRSKIAEGGMGVVYRAVHPTLKRDVILKRLTLRGKKGVVERFRREARLMMDFRNDHIVDVYDHFKTGTSYYIVEEFVDGVSLDKLIRKERYLSNEAALLIFYEACKALKYAHDKGVVHRDIKPGNILISKDGEVKLTDFGIAREQDDEEQDSGLTTAGMTLGTVAYMSPEQIHSSRDVDRRADIYSMGVMLYEMVSGKLPYPGSFTPETLNLIQKGRHKAVQKINPKTAALVRRLIKKSMRPSSRRRYQDVGEILAVLRRALKTIEEPDIQEKIKAYVGGTRLTRVYRRGGGLISIVFPLIGLIIVATGVGLGYREGFYHEYLAPRRYGAVTFSVSRATEAHVTVTGIGTDAQARAIPMRADEKGIGLVSRRLYLPVGAYRVEVAGPGAVHTRFFLLRPREVQRSFPETAEGRQIEVPLGTAPQTQVELETFFYDRRTGADLTRSTRVLIRDGSRWIPWNVLSARRVVTGAEHQLKLERAGYLEAVVTLRPELHQSRVKISVAMTPIPGTVRLVSDTAGVKVLLNGAASYLTGDENPVYLPLERLSGEPQILTLSPGNYQVSLKKANLTRSATIKVQSGVTTDVNIAVGDDAIEIRTSS